MIQISLKMGKNHQQRQSVSQRRTEWRQLRESEDHKQIIPHSTTKLIKHKKQRQTRICRGVKRQLKGIMKKGNFSKQSNLKRLQSVLNIKSENEIVPSAFNIPSIENMISLNELKSIEELGSIDSGSLNSFNECLSYRVIESQPELMLTYVVLIQKAMKKLGFSMQSRQNEKMIKGIWNLVVKFWKDSNEESQYKNLNQKIEWGLFELLNFDLKVNRRERMVKQIQISSFAKLDL